MNSDNDNKPKMAIRGEWVGDTYWPDSPQAKLDKDAIEAKRKLEQIAMHRERARLAIRMKIGADWDGTASNDNLSLAHTATARRQAARAGTRLIAANKERTPKERVRYRGTRPAWNWLAKQDKKAAAALWLFARQMLPDPANDNLEPGPMNIDRRADGKARGPKALEFDAASYLAIPPVRPRFGDAEPEPVMLQGWHSDGLAIKRQRQPDDYPLYPFGSFTRCLPGVAWQYGSLVDVVGKPRPGVSRGDPRRVDLPDPPGMSDRIFLVIDTMLAGATLAGIGEVLGANGGYQDRVGRKAMREAGQWALAAAA